MVLQQVHVQQLLPCNRGHILTEGRKNSHQTVAFFNRFPLTSYLRGSWTLTVNDEKQRRADAVISVVKWGLSTLANIKTGRSLALQEPAGRYGGTGLSWSR